ncbi:MAG: GntR family transcriptional regulator [Chitinivibrionales bacterium]|nr:GntR family transcriptional regulator [Chitinivibrionales bacterium]
MNEKLSPAVRRALRYVLDLIESGALQDSGPVPIVTELAHQAQVSRITMIKAVAMLKREGIFEGRQGKRFVFNEKKYRAHPEFALAAGRSTETREKPSPYGWQRVYKRMQQDILAGVFSSRRVLPGFKELQNRYGVSYRTVKKSLHELIENGTITLDGKKPVIAPMTRSGSVDKILLIGHASSHNTRVLELTQREESCLQLIEAECARACLKLEIFALPRYEEGMEPAISGVPDDKSIMGYIVFVSKAHKAQFEMLNTVARFKKPVAILYELGEWSLPRNVLASARVKIFSSAFSDRVGRQAAQYMLGLEHTNIAYISPYHRAAWSIHRLQGLQDMYATAGFPGRIMPCIYEGSTRWWDLISASNDRYQALSIWSALQAWKKRFPGDLHEYLDNEGIDRITLCCATAELYRLSTELCRQALANREVTAWVCANDTIAVMANDYCASQGIAVPEQISLLGFDNQQGAIQRRISSYDFNVRAAAHSIFDFVTRPNLFTEHNKKKHIEIDGFIIERRSTATALTGGQ